MHIVRPVRYLAVGALCALLHNVIVIGADLLGITYPISTAVGTVAVGGIGYCLHSRLTYGAPLSWAAYGRFLTGLGSGYCLSVATLALTHAVMAMPMPIASPLATMVTTIWNYAASGWAIRLRNADSPPVRL